MVGGKQCFVPPSPPPPQVEKERVEREKEENWGVMLKKRHYIKVMSGGEEGGEMNEPCRAKGRKSDKDRRREQK